MTIFKDTEEGKQINIQKDSKVNNWRLLVILLLTFLLKNIETLKLRKAIDKELNSGFYGKRCKS